MSADDGGGYCDFILDSNGGGQSYLLVNQEDECPIPSAQFARWQIVFISERVDIHVLTQIFAAIALYRRILKIPAHFRCTKCNSN